MTRIVNYDVMKYLLCIDVEKDIKDMKMFEVTHAVGGQQTIAAGTVLRMILSNWIDGFRR